MNDNPKIIVSLTSFPAAIPYAVQAIRSVLNGSLLPDKVVLYLTFSQFNEQGGIPQELLQLAEKKQRFEIRDYNKDIRSYRKLIPALADFPEATIVTIDDDVAYNRHMLRDLVRLHKRLPNAILAHRVRKIRLDAPYSEWRKYKWYDFIFKRIHYSRLAMQTGVGGVLYPPHSLDETMLDPAQFMALAPTNDDVWFWAAAVSKGTYVVPLPNGQRTAKGVGKPQQLSLMNINLNPNDDRNSKALNNILKYYPRIRQQIEEDR